MPILTPMCLVWTLPSSLEWCLERHLYSPEAHAHFNKFCVPLLLCMHTPNFFCRHSTHFCMKLLFGFQKKGHHKTFRTWVHGLSWRHCTHVKASVLERAGLMLTFNTFGHFTRHQDSFLVQHPPTTFQFQSLMLRGGFFTWHQLYFPYPRSMHTCISLTTCRLDTYNHDLNFWHGRKGHRRSFISLKYEVRERSTHPFITSFRSTLGCGKCSHLRETCFYHFQPMQLSAPDTLSLSFWEAVKRERKKNKYPEWPYQMLGTTCYIQAQASECQSCSRNWRRKSALVFSTLFL